MCCACVRARARARERFIVSECSLAVLRARFATTADPTSVYRGAGSWHHPRTLNPLPHTPVRLHGFPASCFDGFLLLPWLLASPSCLFFFFFGFLLRLPASSSSSSSASCFAFLPLLLLLLLRLLASPSCLSTLAHFPATSAHWCWPFWNGEPCVRACVRVYVSACV